MGGRDRRSLRQHRRDPTTRLTPPSAHDITTRRTAARQRQPAQRRTRAPSSTHPTQRCRRRHRHERPGLTVLQRVQSSIAEPLQTEVASLASQLSSVEAQARLTSDEKRREASARQAAEDEAAAQRAVIGEMKGQILQLQTDQQEKIDRIRARAAKFAHAWTAGLTWGARILVLILSAWIIWMISVSGEYPLGSLSWVLAVVGVLGFLVSFLPQLTATLTSWEERWARHRSRSKLLEAGFSPSEAGSEVLAS